jgi:uncharacterized protein YecT (DUF1311 family)
MRSVISLILCLSFSTSVFAVSVENWDYAMPHKDKCTGEGQQADNDCLSVEYKETDLRLNNLYKKLNAALADPKPLLESQRAWLKFRDSQCKFTVGADDGGSAYMYSLNACLIDLTEKRILDIQSIKPCNGCVEFKQEYYKNGMWP